MTPTQEVNCIVLKAKSKAPTSVSVTVGTPGISNNIFAFLLMYPHCLKVELMLLGGLYNHCIGNEQGIVVRGRVNKVVDSCILEVASLVISG